ncbi:MAG: peptidylprolyl isomerase [Desulfobacterales bacterium]|nr:peptidylprolyl isomerase [Desulfobacterales bacterium]
MSEAVQNGDTISVHYTGKLENGEVFDSSKGRDPLKFTVGKGMLIKGFDTAVVDMKPGEKKSVSISPDEGYGLSIDDFILAIPKTGFPEDFNFEVGAQLGLPTQDGQTVPAKIVELNDDTITVDANHPLAGKTLIFDIEIAEVGLEPEQMSCSGSTEEGGCGSCSCS